MNYKEFLTTWSKVKLARAVLLLDAFAFLLFIGLVAGAGLAIFLLLFFSFAGSIIWALVELDKHKWKNRY